MNDRDRIRVLWGGSPDTELHMAKSTTSQRAAYCSAVRNRLRYAGFMLLPSLEQILDAKAVVYRYMPPTPQYSWPLINERFSAGGRRGTEVRDRVWDRVWVKHENHTPVGAFKLRGALVYFDWLTKAQPELAGVVAATRGNHGQGVGMAARLYGVKAVIVVPYGNSQEKNRAMLAQGVELVEYGSDFQESLEFACTLATRRGFHLVDSFDERLVMGTATYALEFFEAAPPLDVVYVPIGLGSSICGVSAARNALGRKTEIVGVVAADSPSYAFSFKAGKIIEAPSRTVIADGLACRTPNAAAMNIIQDNVARVIKVAEAEIAKAMCVYHQDTHNLAEGAGAAALAGALQERGDHDYQRVGIILTGGNVDREVFRRVLAENLE